MKGGNKGALAFTVRPTYLYFSLASPQVKATTWPQGWNTVQDSIRFPVLPKYDKTSQSMGKSQTYF